MSIFNVPINPNISGSLALRQELMGRETRSPQELSFLNSNTAWVKLNSSVNVDGYGDTLAKQNVLVGGTLFNGNQRFGVGVENNNAYSLKNSKGENNILGIRPMPGITSVSIDNIGAYGSVRKATVNFQCWDIKQLEVLESLYMRPGYTVLLEFGRNIKLVNKNGINSIEAVRSNDTFFTESNINLHDYLKILHKASVDSGGNYDAFFGYITNYGWAVRPDGGYDCHTEIISTGEILESIKVNYSAAGAINFASLGSDASNASFKGLILSQHINEHTIPNNIIQQINEEYVENALAGLIYETYVLCKNNFYKYNTSNVEVKKDESKIIIDYSHMFYDSAQQSESEKKLLNGSKDNFYITLESFCNLFTNFILPNSYSDKNAKTGDLASLSTYNRDYLDKAKDELLCLFNTYITSVNPDVCLIKNPNWGNILSQTNIQVNVAPIKSDPLSDPDIDTTNQGKISKWIRRIVEGKSLVGVSTSKYLDKIFKEINDDFKNSKLSLDQYAKKFLKNYQTVRGGIETTTIQEPKIIETRVQSTTGPGYFIKRTPSTTETVPKTVSNRVWAVYKITGGNDITTNTLRNSPYKDSDKTFGDLVAGQLIDGVYINLRKALTNPLYLNDKTEQAVKSQADAIAGAAQNQDALNKLKTNLSSIAKNYQQLQNTQLVKEFQYSIKGKSSYGIIGNIYINLKHLYKLAKDPNLFSQDISGKNILSATSFLKALLRNIQESLGNLNNFEIHIDDKDGIGRIIDLNYINRDGTQGIFEFEIGNNKSIVRDLKLESQIFSDQSSMIAISAQSEAGKIGLDNSTNVSYNLGISDRMLPKKDSPITGGITDNQSNNFISALSTISNKFFKPLFQSPEVDPETGGTEPNSFNISEAGNYSNSLRDIISFFSFIYNTDNKEKAIFPTQISLTLDGISGFVIGNLFKVNQEFIPNYYKKANGKLGYLITKIGQSIQDNSWTTTIQGYPFNIDSSTITANDGGIPFDLIINYNPNIVGNSSAGNIISIVNLGGLNLTGDWIQIASSLISSFEGFLDKAEMDRTKFRGGYGSDKIIINGSVLNVTKDTTFTKKQAIDTLEYSIKSIYAPVVIRQIGQPIWDKLKNTQKASLVSYAYNVGSLKKDIVASLKRGDLDAASNYIRKGPVTGVGSNEVIEGLVTRRNKEAEVFNR
jgi:GH24 family phage-related lysozyme (muramidase)